MHMDIRGKDVASDRDLAAKRTSENTALAAKKAFENGYQPHRKSNWLKVQEEVANPSVPFTGTTPYDPTLYGLKPAASTPRPAHPPKEKERIVPQTPRPPPSSFTPLSPEETKVEQARLLTVLRTLQPLTVVDQLCKAVVYFGGIPNAPPPQDGKFPESAEANGPGSVFVGWLSEIFPDLDGQGKRKPRPVRVSEAPAVQSAEKRGRGRPKGSKASKVRSDKGIKKGSKKNPLTEVLDADENENEDSWVDVDETIMGDGGDVVITGAQARHTPDPQAAVDAEALSASAKKRGRPKGSKNQAKNIAAGEEVAPNPPPKSALFSLGKKTVGSRPRGVKKSKATAASKKSLPTTNGTNGPVSTTTLEPEDPPPPYAAQIPEQPPLQEPEDRLTALVQPYNQSEAISMDNQASSFQPVNSTPVVSQPQAAKKTTAKGNAKSQPAKKRKRNAKDADPMGQSAVETASAVSNAVDATNAVPVNGTTGTSSVDLATPAPPPPKRQRKSRAKAKTAAKSTPTPADQPTPQVSQTPVVPPAPAPEPAPATQPADTQLYTSPTFDELNAELEQHHEQSLPHPETTTTHSTSQVASSQPEPPQPPIPQGQSQPASNSRQFQQTQQRSDPQRAVARQRQQQTVGRTASPIVGQMSTASPHMSVQSASPNIDPSHTASPNLHQQRISNSQTPTSVNSQAQSQQARNTQSYYPQPTASTQSSYGQQPGQQYASPQPAKQQFAVPQPQQQQSYSSTAQQPAQQQQNYTSQQPQYSHQKQPSYSSQTTQQQYASPQQQYASQGRQQPYATSSAGTTSQTLAAQSPQYGTSTAAGYNSNDASFRTNSAAGINFNSSAYGSNQASNSSRGNNLYSNSTTAGSYGNPTQQISSYATAPRRTLPTTTAHQTSVQNVQSMPQSLGNFSDFGGLGFDGNLMSGLDNPAGGHSSLNMNTAPYNMGAGNVARSSATGTGNFGFDSTLRSDGNSYFGLRR